MGAQRRNKSTGDMLVACRDKHKGAPAGDQEQAKKSPWRASNATSKFEQLKQTSLSYLMLGGAAGRPLSSRSNKSLAWSDQEEERDDAEESDDTGLAGRRKPLLAERCRIEPDADSRDVTRRPRRRREANAFSAGKNARSSCYIWLAEPAEQPDEEFELAAKMDCQASERHIRLALSSPMLHGPASAAAEARRQRHELEPLVAPGPAFGGPSERRVSHESLAETRATMATRKSGNRRAARQRHKLAAGSQESQTRRRLRLRRRPAVCDSDSDTCEPGAELRRAAPRSHEARHRAHSAADLTLMLHTCETIDAGSKSADSTLDQFQPCAIVASLGAGEQQCASSAGLGGPTPTPPPPLQQTSAQPGQRRGRPTSSAAENNVERRQKDSASGGAADKVASAPARQPANGHSGPLERHKASAASPAESAASERELGRLASRPERNRASSGQDQDHPQSWARARDAREGKFKLTSASERASRADQPESGPQQSGSGAMGVDVNSVVSRLVDSCAHSWRRGHSSLLAGNSACYKVAQPGALGSAGRPGEQLHQQGQQEGEVARTDRAGGKQVAASPLARPAHWARSPASLQRQTNARLARHRLKIQQQRQEQLANLARREQFRYRDHCDSVAPAAPFCSTTSFHSSSQHPDHTEIEILESEPSGGPARASSLVEQSLNYFRSLVGRVPAALKPSHRQSRELPRPGSSRQEEPSASARLPLANFSGQPPARSQARSFRVGRAARSSGAAGASSSSSSGQFALTVEPPHLERAIDANIGPPAAPLARRPRDLAQVLAQANVIVHRSASDLLRGAGGAAVGSIASRHQQHRHHHHQEARPSDRSEPSRSRQQQQQQHQFRFEYCRMGAEQQKGRPAAGRAQKADDTHSNSADSSASSTLSLSRPFCKICHLSSSRHGDKLISPCKCSGTMQFVHCGCLLKWLEISNRTNEKRPMSCELCAHEYTWHKQFNLKQMKLPKCSLGDIFLHSVFVLALGVMMFCALAPIFNTAHSPSGQSLVAAGGQLQVPAQTLAQTGAHGPRPSPRAALTFADDALGPLMSNPARRSSASFKSASSSAAAGSRLANDEKFILLCAAAFFVAFFVAVYAQTKTRDTLYGLIVKFANMNLTYYITEYDHGQQHQQPQPHSTSNKCAAEHCNSLRNPTDSNHGDLNHCQAPAPAGIREACPLGQTDARHRPDNCESPTSARHSKRT